MDLYFLINSSVLLPVIKLLSLLTFGLINSRKIEELIDKTYPVLFGLLKLDVQGFRRLRTIS
jgi:hypothetical protein